MTVWSRTGSPSGAPWASRRGRHTLRVAYYDTDKAGVAHHAAYLRFLENARVSWWRDLGFDYARFELETGTGLPVVEVKARYRLPARFDDLLEVETWVSEASRASVWFDSIVRRGENVLLLEARIRIACASFADGTVRRIPDVLLDACLEPGHGI